MVSHRVPKICNRKEHCSKGNAVPKTGPLKKKPRTSWLRLNHYYLGGDHSGGAADGASHLAKANKYRFLRDGSANRETVRRISAAGRNMLLQASRQSGSAHVVVLGNEKGGSGKSTIALHVAVALMKAGQRVATIDLDCRQQSLTRYINNRSAWARRTGLDLELPVHCCIKRGETMQIADNETSEFQQFIDAVSAIERKFDFIVIDTPGSDSYLMRLAHSMADTLVTPINDSFLDFDVLGTVDPVTYAVTGESHYAEVVRDMRRKRRQLDGAFHRLDRGPQPIVDAGDAQQTAARRRPQ